MEMCAWSHDDGVRSGVGVTLVASTYKVAGLLDAIPAKQETRVGEHKDAVCLFVRERGDSSVVRCSPDGRQLI
jgi:hypothetical protein